MEAARSGQVLKPDRREARLVAHIKSIEVTRI
jgi:hypothetical protein